jgi:hypothetical protein
MDYVYTSGMYQTLSVIGLAAPIFMHHFARVRRIFHA